MVKEELQNGKKVYICDLCCFAYKEKKLAEKCEAWCKKHKSCNMKITCFAINGEKYDEKNKNKY